MSASTQMLGWLAPLLTSDTPALPTPWAMQWGLQASWSVVLAWLGFVLVRRWSAHRLLPLCAALLLAAWAWLPGSYSAAYWLGLAFQAPSIATVLLCATLLGVDLVHAFPQLKALQAGTAVPKAAPGLIAAPCGLALPLGAVVLGWALLLDTFALLPVSLYAWGFSPAAAALVLLMALLPWVWRRHSPGHWLTPVAVLLFVLLRLPSGNVWDAVLDPWLWLGLQGYLLRRFLVLLNK